MFGQHVAQQDPHPAHAGDARGRDVVAGGDAGDEGLASGARTAGAPASPMASTAPVAPTPKMTAKNSASRSPGNATAMLTDRRRRAARRGGRAGTARCRAASPTTTAIAVASRASSTDSRVATRTREKMSRPRLSVPAQCSADGPARMLPVSTAFACVRPQDRGHDGEHQHADHEQRRGQAERRAEHPSQRRAARSSHVSPPGSSSAGRAAPGRRRRRCSRAARRRRTRARWPARPGSPC